MTDLEMMKYLLAKVDPDIKAQLTAEERKHQYKAVEVPCEPEFEIINGVEVQTRAATKAVWKHEELPTTHEIVFRTNGFLFDENGNLIHAWAEYD